MGAFSAVPVASGQLTDISDKLAKKHIRWTQLAASFTRQTGPEQRIIERVLGPAIEGFFYQQARCRVQSVFPGCDGADGTALSALQAIPRPVSINNILHAVHGASRFLFRPFTKA